MKVLLLNGSPHAKGCTWRALSEVEKTLQAVALFQTTMNEKRDAGFTVIDPADPDSIIDVKTLKAIFAAERSDLS